MPADPIELRRLEEQYGGSFNSHLGSLNYYKEYTRYELMYSCNRYGMYIMAPHHPAFRGIKRMVRYLVKFFHCPIMYPANVPIDGTHILQHEVTPDKTTATSVNNTLTSFVDGGEARALNDKRAIACVIMTFLGVAIAWKAKTQPGVAAHSTDSEIRSLFLSSKINQYLRPILEHMGVEFTDATQVHEDSQPTLDIILSDQVTSRVKHIAVPIAYVQEQVAEGMLDPTKIHTSIQPADMGTKAQSGPLLARHDSYLRGVRFYPPKGSEHYRLGEFDKVGQPYRPRAPSKDD